jgi:hypothetical protein
MFVAGCALAELSVARVNAAQATAPIESFTNSSRLMVEAFHHHP